MVDVWDDGEELGANDVWGSGPHVSLTGLLSTNPFPQNHLFWQHSGKCRGVEPSKTFVCLGGRIWILALGYGLQRATGLQNHHSTTVNTYSTLNYQSQLNPDQAQMPVDAPE